MAASHTRIRRATGKRATPAPSLQRAPLRRPTASQELESEWVERSTAWSAAVEANQQPRTRRQRSRNPLILCGHGVSLRVDKGTLLIREGFTHYPQEQREHRFFKGSLDLPPHIVIVDGSGAVTFDVLAWLNEQSIPLVRIAWDGSAVLAIGGSGYSADPKKALWQREIQRNETKRTRFMVKLALAKLKASLICLEEVIPPSPARASALTVTKTAIKRLRAAPPRTTDALRVFEGRIGQAYFAAWRGLPLSWRSERRYPIPDEWRAYSTRTSVANRGSYDNQNATHPINAMLNYAYAVIQNEVKIQVIAEGFDPTLGVMHNSNEGKLAFVFDLMEPLRPVVDAAILRFALGQTFSGADFVLRSDGVCRLNPQLARRVAQVAAEAVRRAHTGQGE